MPQAGALSLVPAASAAAPARGTAETRSVLVVDDSRAHRRLMARILGRWGYEVHEAQSGAEALALLDRERIDMVLSDWLMPGMTGLDLCRRVRAGEASGAGQGDGYVYVILLTSKSGGDEVATGLAAGADDFLSKPVDASELRARIAAGERLIEMQRAVVEKNRQLGETLSALQDAHELIARDLVEARHLQQSLVPERSFRFDGACVSLLLQPCGQVGGDLVGAFPAGPGRICVYAIDVSGHGIASALMTARLAGYLSGRSPEHNLALTRAGGDLAMRPPEEICAAFNSLLLEEMATELYFTMLVAEVDLASGAVRLATAGHPHPLVVRACGRVERIEGSGMPIGLLPDAEFGTATLALAPGDRLFLHSDGFTEAVAPDGEMLEHDGLGRLMSGMGGMRGVDMLDGMVWALSDFTGSRDFEDDLSGVLLEFSGPDA